MSRRQRVWKKIHNEIRQIKKASLLGAGVLCALAVALLVGGSVRAAEVAVSGILKIAEAIDIEWGSVEPDSTLEYWHEFSVSLEGSDGFSEFNNSYGSQDSGDTGGNVNPENPVQVSVAEYNSETVFTPEITGAELKWTADNNPDGSLDTWIANNETLTRYENQGTEIERSVTYYRVVDENESNDSLANNLGDFYTEYNSEHANESGCNPSNTLLLVSDSDYQSNYCLELLDTFAQEYNLEQYDQEEGIPLTRDGKAVYQIEMLTVSNLKSQIYVNPFFGSNGTLRLDGLLATSHTYTFTYGTDGEGAPVALQEPTVSTASGAEIGSSDSGPISGEEEILLSTTDTEGVYTLQYAFSE